MPKSIGHFKNEVQTDLIDEGIILSTGDIFDAIGPNNSPRLGTKSSGRGDANLQTIASGVIIDAAVLEFDLIALRDSISFEYVFASEEYPEYVNKGKNDVFGFFIYELGGKALFPINMAKVPNSNQTVSINNVNHLVNTDYFLKSDFLAAHDVAYWKDHQDVYKRANFFQYDGFTTVLNANILLKQGKTYHLKIAIADVGDRIYDSAVMIKAKSLSAVGDKIPMADEIIKQEVDLRLREFKSYQSTDNLSFSIKINFNSNEAKILESSFAELEELLYLLNEFQDLKLEITGHTDNVGSTEDNLLLSKRRAVAVKKYLVDAEVAFKRIDCFGMGESEPIQSNSSEMGRYENRRVEFKLSY